MATMLTDSFSEPLNNATTARIEINAGYGNLTIGQLADGEQKLAGGTLQYLEKQGPPTRTLGSSGSQATLALRASHAGRPWFRLPWGACISAIEWQVHLNPTVSSEITAHSDGGNIRLNLAGMSVTGVSADTGGGNIDLVLPDNATEINVTAKSGAGNATVEIGSGITGSSTVQVSSGAGNVVVRIPSGLVARIHATSGLGKVAVDPRFGKTDDDIYQSPDYDGAADRVEIKVSSGAGNVTIREK